MWRGAITEKENKKRQNDDKDQFHPRSAYQPKYKFTIKKTTSKKYNPQNNQSDGFTSNEMQNNKAYQMIFKNYVLDLQR